MKLGCNYWASHAGTEMWRKWEPEEARKDLQVLRAHGVEYLRVFPNWRDFQPVEPFYGPGARLWEYRLSGDRLPENKYYLDEVMLSRFRELCDMCLELDVKLIVGLVTGWMSGRTFIPPAMYDKNLFSHPTCLYFEQLFVTGFVERFRDHPAIYAWDHGNESQGMGGPESWMNADFWAGMISNAIYSKDGTRPVISGSNALSTDGTWRFTGQADVCDMLVTHPYPFWGVHTTNDTIDYIRTTLYASAINQLYADMGGKPSLVEETGTMGPSVCSEELAADFLRVNFFSVWAGGGEGILWWCAHDQEHLMTAPYTWTMCENELGMTDKDRNPKPVLKEMQRLSSVIKSFDFKLPKASTDAVCLLTREQDTWGVAYMTYVLAKQASLHLQFADAEKSIPDASVYMLPSVKGATMMPKECYLTLLRKVKEGATLYISNDDAVIMGFEELTGNRILDREAVGTSGMLSLNGYEIPYTQNMQLHIENIQAEQVQTPLITKHSYGKGMVYFVNFPVEAMLIHGRRQFDHHVCEIYKEIFKEVIEQHEVKVCNENIAFTIHPDGERIFVVAVNHSQEVQQIRFETDCNMVAVHYGNPECCKPMDAVVLEFVK